MLLYVGCNIDADEVKVPQKIDDCVYPLSNTSKGRGTFDKVDNTGVCIRF